MARTPKPMHAIDRLIAELLAVAVERAEITRRELADRTAMSTNRLGIILRGEQPPATVGEAEVIASAAGVDVFDLFAEAERRAAATTQPPVSNVVHGRFGRLGSAREFAQDAAAHVGKRSIDEEQEVWD